MAETEVKAKKCKLSFQTCIICMKVSLLSELSAPQDEQSWVLLQAVARVRQFEPILYLAHNPTGAPKVHYPKCRAEFTHSKSLSVCQSSRIGYLKAKRVKKTSGHHTTVYGTELRCAL